MRLGFDRIGKGIGGRKEDPMAPSVKRLLVLAAQGLAVAVLWLLAMPFVLTD